MPDDDRTTAMPAAPPTTRGMSTGISIIVASLLLSVAIVAAGWMVSHPDAATRCATSGGNWQVDLSVCWYPQTNQPGLDPSFIDAAPQPPITDAPTDGSTPPKEPAKESSAPAP